MVFDAVILTGGTGARMGGADKAGLSVGGTRFIDRALAAVSGAAKIVVVGPAREVRAEVLWAREEPPGGGPAAALAAGLSEVTAPTVVVLAVDHPFVDETVVARLVDAAKTGDGAILRDADGRDQPLVGAYATEALANRLRGDLQGIAVGPIVGGLSLTRVFSERAAFDVDTRENLEDAQTMAGGGDDG